MSKYYTCKDAAKELDSFANAKSLQDYLNYERHKNKSERKFPSAHKCECGKTWLLNKQDVKKYKEYKNKKAKDENS